LAEVAEYSPCDAHRGGGQGGAEEEIGIRSQAWQQPRPDHESAQQKRERNTDHANGGGPSTDFHQISQARLQTDLQHQDDDSQLGHEGDDRVFRDGVEILDAK
jgi:hypothetical protein